MSFDATLLTDKTRLKEIYDLRVNVWENSGNNQVVNRHLFPNGWYDDLDDKAYHWIITNEEDEIIASARLNIFEHMEEFPYYESMKDLNIPKEAPFGFYSRLVVHPKYRGLKLSLKLVASRMLFCEAMKLRWLQAYSSSDIMKKVLNRYDFDVIGQVEVNYHQSTEPRVVNLFIKDYNYDKEEQEEK